MRVDVTGPVLEKVDLNGLDAVGDGYILEAVNIAACESRVNHDQGEAREEEQ